MKNLTAIIIDDERHVAELLKISINTLFPDISIENIHTEWEEALIALKKNDYDLIFLDVLMPGKNGMDLLRLLPGLKGEIIFVTAHEEYAVAAFKHGATGYILKPVDDEDLTLVINRARASIEKNDALFKTDPGSSLIGIPNGKGIDYIRAEEIIYLEAYNRCTKIKLAERELLSSYNLGRFKELLNVQSFFQVHRSYIINLAALKRYFYHESTIVMSDDSEIPISRSMREVLLNKFSTVRR